MDTDRNWLIIGLKSVVNLVTGLKNQQKKNLQLFNHWLKGVSTKWGQSECQMELSAVSFCASVPLASQMARCCCGPTAATIRVCHEWSGGRGPGTNSPCWQKPVLVVQTLPACHNWCQAKCNSASSQGLPEPAPGPRQFCTFKGTPELVPSVPQVS